MYFLLNYKQYIRLLYTIESANTKKIPRIKVLSNTRDLLWLYNKCWGDTTTVSLPTLFFLQKNKHTRLTYFTIKVTNSQRKDVSLYAYY